MCMVVSWAMVEGTGCMDGFQIYYFPGHLSKIKGIRNEKLRRITKEKEMSFYFFFHETIK